MAQEDHRVSDCCTCLSFRASDRKGGRSRQHCHERSTPINGSVRWVQNWFDDVQEKSEQVHVAFLALTEVKSFDIVLEAPGEALRRLVRRWGLLSEESAELFCDKSWFQIGANYKISPQDLRSGKNCFADTRYQRSKSSGTTTPALDEDIKTAALEALVPSEFEQHLPINRARKSKPTMKPTEVNLHSRQKVTAKSTSDPMEVDRQKVARRMRKDKVMARTARKKVKIRTPIRIQARTLFVGTVVRKASWLGWNPRQRRQRKNEERHRERNSTAATGTWRRLKLLSDHRTLITKVC